MYSQQHEHMLVNRFSVLKFFVSGFVEIRYQRQLLYVKSLIFRCVLPAFLCDFDRL